MSIIFQDSSSGAGTLPPLNLPDFTASGAIGSAASTVDTNINQVTLNQTTASISLTVPAVTIATNYKVVDFQNIGTASLILSFFGGTNANVPAKSTIRAAWNGVNWVIASAAAPLAEVGQATVASSIAVNSGSANSAGTAVLITSFTLPSAGIWDVTVDLSGNNGNYSTGGTPTDLRAAVYLASTPTTILGNEYQINVCRAQAAGSSQVIGFGQTSRTFRITTTASTAYQIRAWATGITGSSIEPTSGGNGTSQVNWVKVSGASPVIGQTVDYVNIIASVSQTSLVAGQAITFNSPVIQGNIPFSSGVFTLQPGKTYKLIGSAGQGSGATSNPPIIQWRNITASTLIGVAQYNDVVAVLSSTPMASVLAEAWITPTVTTTVRLEVINAGGSGTNIGTSDANGNRMPYASILQIGTTPSTVEIVPLPLTQKIISNGTYTRSPNMKYAEVTAIGGGGGGVGGVSSTVGQTFCGSGGNAGAFVKVMLTAAQIGASQTVTIGVGGSGGNGGSTSLGSLFIANGGGGGTAIGAAAGDPGAIASANPVIASTFIIAVGTDMGSRRGQIGQKGIHIQGQPAQNTSGYGGDGASTPFGSGGAGAAGQFTPTSSGSANVGGGNALVLNSGAGGGGAFFGGAIASNISSNGSAGVMFITEYF